MSLKEAANRNKNEEELGSRLANGYPETTR
jgi:hypothetical protein